MNSAILLSGGMDSIALAFWKRPEAAITIDYGQLSAEAEMRAAAAVCGSLHIQHEIIKVDCCELGSGILANKPPLPLAPVNEWWPFRNQLLLTFAGMRAAALGLAELLVGSVKSDRLHADGKPEFFNLIDRLMSFQEGGVRVFAPAINMESAELIRASGVPIEILSWAHSCHTGNLACGWCGGEHVPPLVEI